MVRLLSKLRSLLLVLVGFVVLAMFSRDAFAQTSIITHPSSIKKHPVATSPGEVYIWRVTSNNGLYTSSSDTWTFTVANTGDISGWIWDSTGRGCSDAGSSYELTEGDLDGDVTVNLTTQSIEGEWNPSGFDSYSYIVEDAPYSTGQMLCVNVPPPVDKANFKYGLACVNGSDSGIVSSSCATVDIDDASLTYNLGYKMISAGWFHVINGDVYGGCTGCVDSISVGIPAEDDTLGSFEDALVSGEGSVFSNGTMSVKNPSEDDKFVDDDNKYFTESMYDSELSEGGEFWSDAFSFSAPDNSESVSGCSGFFNSNLDAGKTYETTASCMNTAISNSGDNYSLDEDGVAIVYITDSDTLEFENNFTSSNGDRRVLFVTRGDVLFSADLGEDSPTSSSDPVVEAGIIAEESIVFESNGNDPADDTTIIVEGPLVSKSGEVDFERDRGEQNGYPGQVVVFNPIYLSELKDTKTAVVDISWALQQ